MIEERRPDLGTGPAGFGWSGRCAPAWKPGTAVRLIAILADTLPTMKEVGRRPPTRRGTSDTRRAPLPGRRRSPTNRSSGTVGGTGARREPIADSAEPWYAADQGHVATAYLHRSASIAAEVARLLGHAVDADAFDVLAASARRLASRVPRRRRVPDPRHPGQPRRALAFGVGPDHLRQACAARLVQLIRDAGTHLNTGFLATLMLLPVSPITAISTSRTNCSCRTPSRRG